MEFFEFLVQVFAFFFAVLGFMALFVLAAFFVVFGVVWLLGRFVGWAFK